MLGMSTSGASLPPPSPPPPPPPGNEGGNNKPWWKRWYTIAGAVVVLLLGIAAVAARGGDDESSDSGTVTDTTAIPPETTPPETSEASGATDPPQTTQATETTSAPTTDASATTGPATSTPATTGPTCRYIGTDFADDMQVELSFTNPLGNLPSLEVSYALLDADNVRFLTESAFVELPAADEQFQINDDTVEPVPPGVDQSQIGCTVLDVAEGFSFGDATAPGAEDVCEFESVDSFDDIQVQLTATSPFTETTNIKITYALRGPGDVRFASDSAFVELVAAGETIRSNEDSVTEVPDWMLPDEVTCDILGIEATEF